MLDALNLRHHKPMRQGKAIGPGMTMKMRGLTLMELMVTVVIMAILLVLAVPSFNAFLARGRLSGAAEGLAQDLQLAKSEALRRNANVDVIFRSGEGDYWCYATLEPGSTADDNTCSCGASTSCALRLVESSAHAGVTVSGMMFPKATFYPRPVVDSDRWVKFSHASAGTLQVTLGAAGQVSICSASGRLGHHPACPTP